MTNTTTTNPTQSLPWFDGHLDLACLAVNKRDMLAPLDQLNESTVGCHPPAAITLPELEAANVKLALATIFTEPDGTGPESYPAHDTDRAHAVGRAQLEVYLTWQDNNRIALDLKHALRDDPQVGQIRGGMGVAEPIPFDPAAKIRKLKGPAPLHAGILIENADPIRSPDELHWWAERGVVAVGLAWWKASRYAGGNGTDIGLTDLGKYMVDAIDDLGLVHDLSHLSQRATDELLERTSRPVIASHSNCRSLLGDKENPHWQRHLADETIKEIARRGGVIGLNLVRNFITQGLDKNNPNDRPTPNQAIAHVEYICNLTNSRTHVGLGTDIDGGISANDLPQHINSPKHLHKLTEALAEKGWPQQDQQAFAYANWINFWARV